MTFTHFHDMHSGGGQKHEWGHIVIEADSEDEAREIFEARFGDPDNVTCDCCGADYSVSSDESLAQLTAYHRGLDFIGPEWAKGISYARMTPEQRAAAGKIQRYIEPGEAMPDGCAVIYASFQKNKLTVDELFTRDGWLLISKVSH